MGRGQAAAMAGAEFWNLATPELRCLQSEALKPPVCWNAHSTGDLGSADALCACLIWKVATDLPHVAVGVMEERSTDSPGMVLGLAKELHPSGAERFACMINVLNLGDVVGPGGGGHSMVDVVGTEENVRPVKRYQDEPPTALGPEDDGILVASGNHHSK